MNEEIDQLLHDEFQRQKANYAREKEQELEVKVLREILNYYGLSSMAMTVKRETENICGDYRLSLPAFQNVFPEFPVQLTIRSLYRSQALPPSWFLSIDQFMKSPIYSAYMADLEIVSYDSRPLAMVMKYTPGGNKLRRYLVIHNGRLNNDVAGGSWVIACGVPGRPVGTVLVAETLDVFLSRLGWEPPSYVEA